jgi:hypothetical protein
MADTTITIRAQKHCALTETDLLALASLLLKAGYTVRIVRENVEASGKTPRYE